MAKKSFNNPAMQFISTAEEPEARPAKATKAPREAEPQEGVRIPKGYKLVQETKSTRLQLLIRPTTKDALKEAAEAQGISLNELINQVLDDYIQGKGKA